MEENLVIQNERDAVLMRIKNAKKEYEEKKRLDHISEIEREKATYFENAQMNLPEIFSELSKKFFRMSALGLKKKEKIELEKLISRKALPRAIIQVAFTFCVPIFGWFVGGICIDERKFKSFLYCIYKRRLKKKYGEDWFTKSGVIDEIV